MGVRLQHRHLQLREGGQADVIVYATDNGVMSILGWLYIRLAALASYAY